MNYVIGAGGAGSWLVPALCMLVGRDKVVVVDGDKLEEKNLNRQLFTTEDIGRNKAEALAERYGCEAIPEWFSFGDRAYDQHDVLIVLVDNHPARLAALQTCDYGKCQMLCGANETFSSSAWIYRPEWFGTPIDPRIKFPEITTDASGDPRAASIGCTGKAQEDNPQLVTSNMMAASLTLHLYVLWITQLRKLGGSAIIPKLPWMLIANMSRLETHLVGELNQP